MQILSALPCPTCGRELHLHPAGRQCGCANLHVFKYPSMTPVVLHHADEMKHDTAARIVIADLNAASKTIKTFPPEPDL